MSIRPFVLVFVVALATLSFSAPASAYDLPVNGPIVDDWRPPTNAYGPGNQGVDFATEPGAAVRAAEGGVVTFAGQVGGKNFVVVEHADGLRTTYANLLSVLVGAGQRIANQASVGLSGLTLHFGVRRGEVYFDPKTLFDANVHLVRLDAPNVAVRQAISDTALRWVTAGVDPAGLAFSPISANPTPVSEPAGQSPVERWWLLVLGFGLLSIAARHRHQQSRNHPSARS